MKTPFSYRYLAPFAPQDPKPVDSVCMPLPGAPLKAKRGLMAGSLPVRPTMPADGPACPAATPAVPALGARAYRESEPTSAPWASWRAS